MCVRVLRGVTPRNGKNQETHQSLDWQPKIISTCSNPFPNSPRAPLKSGFKFLVKPTLAYLCANDVSLGPHLSSPTHGVNPPHHPNAPYPDIHSIFSSLCLRGGTFGTCHPDSCTSTLSFTSPFSTFGMGPPGHVISNPPSQCLLLVFPLVSLGWEPLKHIIMIIPTPRRIRYIHFFGFQEPLRLHGLVGYIFAWLLPLIDPCCNSATTSYVESSWIVLIVLHIQPLGRDLWIELSHGPPYTNLMHLGLRGGHHASTHIIMCFTACFPFLTYGILTSGNNCHVESILANRNSPLLQAVSLADLVPTHPCHFPIPHHPFFTQ